MLLVQNYLATSQVNFNISEFEYQSLRCNGWGSEQENCINYEKNSIWVRSCLSWSGHIGYTTIWHHFTSFVHADLIPSHIMWKTWGQQVFIRETEESSLFVFLQAVAHSLESLEQISSLFTILQSQRGAQPAAHFYSPVEHCQHHLQGFIVHVM